MITEKKYGTTSNGEVVYLYTLEAANGVTLTFCNIGAAIVSISVPDKNGVIGDVVTGYDNLMSYIGDGPCFGKVPGRFANRIANGTFELDGKRYNLPINNGPNHLHGGPNGYANRVWNSKIDGDSILFTLSAPDNDDGYPGAVEVQARYKWVEGDGDKSVGALDIELSGETDSATIINLTNHVYFNLNGEGNGDILGHNLKLYASNYLPTDSSLAPTGEIASVLGTPMDFTKGEVVGSRHKDTFPALEYGKGYDACWVVDKADGSEKVVAELWSEESGRLLRVITNQPGIVVYTGNWLSGCDEGKRGHIYNDYDAIALECQNFPEAPNKSNFPSCVLRNGEKYFNKIIFKFEVL